MTEVTDIAEEVVAVLMMALLGMTAALMAGMEEERPPLLEVRALERTSVSTRSARGASCRGRAGTIVWTAVATTTTEEVGEESRWTGLGPGQMRTRARASEVVAGLSIVGATQESFFWRWNSGIVK